MASLYRPSEPGCPPLQHLAPSRLFLPARRRNKPRAEQLLAPFTLTGGFQCNVPVVPA